MGKQKIETHGPVGEVLKALGWSVWEWAATGEVDYSVASHARSGYFARIPPALMAALAPYLKEVGQSEERLQKEYCEWRASLSADVRRKAMKYTEVRRLHPTIDPDPRDEALSNALLERR